MLQAKVIDALGRKHHVRTRLQNHLHLLRHHARLPFTDLLELCRIVNDHVDAHLHPPLLQVHIQHSNLRVCDPRLHRLRSDRAVQCIPLHKHRLRCALSVCLQHVYRLDWVFDLIPRVARLDTADRIHDHVREKVRIRSDEFARHAGFRDVDQRFST